MKLFIFLKKEYFILSLIILAGALLRLLGVFSNSFAFTYDVGRDMLALWDIAYNHKIFLIGQTTGIQGVFYGPWWYYILTPFFILFKGSPQGIAFVMALIGIFSIYLSFYIGKRIGNAFLGLLMALFVSLSPSMISLSSQIWNPNLAPFFTLLIFLILEKIYLFKHKTKVIYFLGLGVLLALNIDIEILWGVLLTFGILISLLVILKKQLRIKQLLFLILGIFIIILPRIIFELRHNFLMTKSFIAFLSAETLEDKLSLGRFLEDRFYAHFYQLSHTFLQESGFLAILIFLFILLTLLFYKKASKIMQNFLLTSFIVLLVFYIGTLIFSHALWSHYLVGLPVFYIFLFSASIFFLTKKFNHKAIPAVIILTVLIFGIKPIGLIDRFTNLNWEGDAALYRNQLSVVDYVYKQAEGNDFKYVVYTPPVHDYTYRYLFQWYGPKEYKYLPNKEAKIAYFIIEPDLNYPDRPKWWLEARVNDGKIIKSVTLKGGIVVQTRVH